MIHLSTAPTTTDDPEEPIASRTVQRDQPNPPSLKTLVTLHLDFVWRSLRRFGVSNGDVDDATQRVFLIANEKLDRIQVGSERSFLIGVAARVASHARRSYHRREAAEHGFSTTPPEASPDPEELTQKREARELLDRVLDAMPSDLRAVFVLFELEELSIDDTAALLALPRGTVASRLRRAREVFHVQAKLLSGAGADAGDHHD
jgi:RNA polymerase sigma-70 factor (ECF subfamily)